MERYSDGQEALSRSSRENVGLVILSLPGPLLIAGVWGDAQRSSVIESMISLGGPCLTIELIASK